MDKNSFISDKEFSYFKVKENATIQTLIEQNFKTFLSSNSIYIDFRPN
jgi:hypothetical protein